MRPRACAELVVRVERVRREELQYDEHQQHQRLEDVYEHAARARRFEDIDGRVSAAVDLGDDGPGVLRLRLRVLNQLVLQMKDIL